MRRTGSFGSFGAQLLGRLEPDPLISPEGLRLAKISQKELAAIDLFLYTVAQLAQLAIIISLLLPMLHLTVLPQFLFAILSVVNTFKILTGIAN